MSLGLSSVGNGGISTFKFCDCFGGNGGNGEHVALVDEREEHIKGRGGFVFTHAILSDCEERRMASSCFSLISLLLNGKDDSILDVLVFSTFKDGLSVVDSFWKC